MVKLFVYRNVADYGDPKTMLAPRTLEALLEIGGAKLGIKRAKFAFTANGDPITNETMADLVEGDEVFISETDVFFQNSATAVPNNYSSMSSSLAGAAPGTGRSTDALAGPSGSGSGSGSGVNRKTGSRGSAASVSVGDSGHIYQYSAAILGSGGAGKCFARDTNVLRADGSVVKVQNIARHDTLLGDDGSARTVLDVTRGVGRLFRISSQTDAGSFVCNDQHILALCAPTTVSLDAKHNSVAMSQRVDTRGNLVREWKREFASLSLARAFFSATASSLLHPSALCRSASPAVSGFLHWEVRVDSLFASLSASASASAFAAWSSRALPVPASLALAWRVERRDGKYLFAEKDLYQLSITALPSAGEYFGFSLSGNARFLLEDRTVAHNSSLTLRFFRGAFADNYDPTIEDAFRNSVLVDDYVSVLDLLDTAGQEEYMCMSEQWVKKKQGFIIVYAINDASSFHRLSQFYDLLDTEYGDDPEGIPPIVLCGNKSDLDHDRQVMKSDGQRVADTWHSDFVEASAKTADNVELLFHTLVRRMRGSTGADGAAGSVGGRSSGRRVGGCALL